MKNTFGSFWRVTWLWVAACLLAPCVWAADKPCAPAAAKADEAAKAAKGKTAADAEGWENIFDGKTMDGWMISDFAAKGEVKVEPAFRGGSGAIVINMTDELNGITLTATNNLPHMNYEVSVEAMKLDGSDFFCGLTFPVGKSAVSLICGGWGGGVVGISSIDDMDASENETTKFMNFEKDRWYHIRVRVTPDKIEAWIDKEQLIDATTKGHRLSLRAGSIDSSLPFGIATYQTRTAVRSIKWRRF